MGIFICVNVAKMTQTPLLDQKLPTKKILKSLVSVNLQIRFIFHSRQVYFAHFVIFLSLPNNTKTHSDTNFRFSPK